MAILMKKAHVKRRSSLQVTHKRIRTATVIYNVLLSILILLRGSGEPVGPPTCFESKYDRMVMKVWCEKNEI